MNMTDYLSKGLVSATTDLKETLNDELTRLSAPNIGYNTEEYYRTENFVEFNAWLQNAPRKELTYIINDFGLLPMIYSLSGINVTTAALMQEEARVNLRGHIRYINLAIICIAGKRFDDALVIGKDLFGESFEYENITTADDLRYKIIADLVQYLVNTRSDITYEQSLGRVLKLINDE